MAIQGVDVSRYQGNVNWNKAKLAGAERAYIRMTVGNYYADPLFTQNYNGAKAAGLKVSAYHVVTPEHSYNSQMTWILNTLAGRNLDLALALDCELDRGQTKQTIYSCIKKLVRESGNNFAKTIIYTRKSWWDVFVGKENFGCDLWVANYGVSEPLLPAAWDKWVGWQYSADGNGLGYKYGAESNSIDLNWWAADAPPPVTPPDLTDKEKLDILWQMHQPK